jgi:hypothetical protein
MTHTKRLVALACAATLVTLSAMAQDKKPAEAKMEQGTTKVLVDNDKMVVTEVTYKPGAGSTMRERNARATRALTDGKMERATPDGKKETVEWKAGQVRYFPKETFANKNVGTKDMVLYVVTPK